MRIGYASTSQTQFYDRSPVTRTSTSYQNVVPHGQTTRWTYTVPTGKRAFVNSALTSIMRTLAAAPVGFVNCEIDITALDTTSAQLVLVRTLNNTVADQVRMSVGGTAPMVAGEVLSAVDSDTSTGGAMEFIQSAWITEFNAAP